MSKMIFNRMQYYILSKFISPFVIAVVFFLCFLVIFYAFRLIGIMISRDVALFDSLQMLIYLSVGFLPTVFPLATFFGINYSMNRLCEDSEFVAMRSFGMSKFKILLPILLFSILISISLYSMNYSLIPNYQKLFKNMMIKLTAKGVLTDIKPGQFFSEIPGNILYAKNVSPKTRVMRNLFLWQDSEKEMRVITSSKGVMLKEYIDKHHTPSLRLHLTDGNIYIRDKKSKSYQKILFKEYDFPLMKGGGAVGNISKEKFKTTPQLLKIINNNQMEISKIKDSNRIKDLKKNMVSAQLAYWGRISGAIQIILFMILGFCLGITNSRNQNSKGGMLVFGLVVLYYLLFFLGIGFVKKGILLPFIGSSLSTLVFTFLCCYYYKKMDWNA